MENQLDGRREQEQGTEGASRWILGTETISSRNKLEKMCSGLHFHSYYLGHYFVLSTTRVLALRNLLCDLFFRKSTNDPHIFSKTLDSPFDRELKRHFHHWLRDVFVGFSKCADDKNIPYFSKLYSEKYPVFSYFLNACIHIYIYMCVYA